MDLHTVVALILSGAIGISLGLLGGGGSILAVPVLVYVAGIEAKESVAMSLAIVGSTRARETSTRSSITAISSHRSATATRTI